MSADVARSWLVLADGYLTERAAKTAHGVIRYSPDPIAAVLDRDHAGSALAEVMPSLRRDAPIVGTVREAVTLGATSLLLGVATPGGWIPDHWRAWVVEAISSGMEVANGLHRFLNDDPELVELAAKHGARLWDVRKPPDDIPLFTGKSVAVDKRIITTVGSDCGVGKMTVSLELARAAERTGRKAEFIATGQTGVLIAGWGIAVDRVISDFASGAAEKLVCDASEDSEVVIVEGQGSLWHPAYAGVTLALLHGSAPEALVLCHQARHVAIEEPPFTRLPPLKEMIDVYEQAAATVRPARVACVAVNCHGLADDDARDELARVEDETGLVAGDVFRGDADKLWAATDTVLGAR